MDIRRFPANDYVAADFLRSKVDAPKYVKGQAASIKEPFVDLLSAPHGPRDRQLLFGTPIKVYDKRDGYAFVQSETDNYVGYVAVEALGAALQPTHCVSVLSTHVYIEPTFKAKDVTWLPMGSLIVVTDSKKRFFETNLGWIPQEHLSSIECRPTDPVAVAEEFLNTPYLWGGNTSLGIDCSGLVQVASRVCGFDCPADSDQQFQEFGDLLPAESKYKRGDLLFWKGHVAWVFDEDTLLHANAFHMKTVKEPLLSALDRIEKQGDGNLIGHKRFIP